MYARLGLLLFVLLFLIGCTVIGSPRIELHDMAVREARLSSPTAVDLNFRCICDTETGETTSQAYLTIYNRGGAADRLLKVETDLAVRVDLRAPSDLEEMEGMGVLVESVTIPAWGSVVFEPGKYQMALTGLKEDLPAGQTVTLRMFFEHSGAIEVQAGVIARD